METEKVGDYQVSMHVDSSDPRETLYGITLSENGSPVASWWSESEMSQTRLYDAVLTALWDSDKTTSEIIQSVDAFAKADESSGTNERVDRYMPQENLATDAAKELLVALSNNKASAEQLAEIVKSSGIDNMELFGDANLISSDGEIMLLVRDTIVRGWAFFEDEERQDAFMQMRLALQDDPHTDPEYLDRIAQTCNGERIR